MLTAPRDSHHASARTSPLGVDTVVAAACAIIERDGLAGFSMRKLGRELSVDPMAVYHYVPNKTALLALVTDRTLATMDPPDPDIPWEEWIREWALRYWDIVARHRDLIVAGLSDPEIGAGGMPLTRQLVVAVARSGLAGDLVEATAFVIVDAVHGSALGVASLADRSEGRVEARRLFEIGLDTILSGIATRADAPPADDNRS